jgi:hypothetical protein
MVDGPAKDHVDRNGGEIVIIGMESREKPIVIAAVGGLAPKDVEKLIKLAAMTKLER